MPCGCKKCGRPVDCGEDYCFRCREEIIIFKKKLEELSRLPLSVLSKERK